MLEQLHDNAKHSAWLYTFFVIEFNKVIIGKIKN